MGIVLLLVDDEPAHRLLARRALARGGCACDVIEAGSLEEALSAVAAHPELTIAVIDLNLGACSGLDLIAALAVPAIIISTSLLEEDVFRSYRAGAACFIQKSADASEYAASLSSAVRFCSGAAPAK